MLELLKQKTNTLLGIEIGSRSVKLLELSQEDTQYRVEAYAMEPLAPGLVVDTNINNIDTVGDVIKKLVSKSKTSARNAAVAVSGAGVITRVIDMDASLSDEDMENQIMIEVDQYIPFPIDEVAIDFEVQGMLENNPGSAEVLIAACRREHVEMREAVLNLAGLTARVVDIEAYAIERAFTEMILPQLKLSGTNSMVALMNIGTALNVLQNGQIIYTREQMLGDAQLIEEIQRRYEMTTEEAELAWRTNNLPENYGPEVLEPFKKELAQQIFRSVQFFSSSSHNDVDCIVLAGNVASIAGLDRLVEKTVGAPCVVANPFADMAIADNVNISALTNDAPAMIIPCGLAMRSFD